MGGGYGKEGERGDVEGRGGEMWRDGRGGEGRGHVKGEGRCRGEGKGEGKWREGRVGDEGKG